MCKTTRRRRQVGERRLAANLIRSLNIIQGYDPADLVRFFKALPEAEPDGDWAWAGDIASLCDSEGDPRVTGTEPFFWALVRAGCPLARMAGEDFYQETRTELLVPVWTLAIRGRRCWTRETRTRRATHVPEPTQLLERLRRLLRGPEKHRRRAHVQVLLVGPPKDSALLPLVRWMP